MANAIRSGYGPADAAPQPADGSRITLVDDNSALRESVRLLFKSVGIEVVCYHSPMLFLQDMPQSNCILLDVRMPEMSGIETHRRLREAGVKTPVIFLTGHGNVAMAVEAMRDGAFDFMEKPFDDQHLIDVVFAAIYQERGRMRSVWLRDEAAEKLARLTARERHIADRISEGESSRDIAGSLGLSVRTIEGYRSRILAKLEADSVVQMIRVIDEVRHWRPQTAARGIDAPALD